MRLIAPAMLAFALGACDSQLANETTEFRVVEQTKDVPLFPLLSKDVPPPILVPTTGTLVRDGQCLFLDGPRGRALILWRAGSRLGQEGDALVVREGPTAARDPAPALVVGSEITGAGGVQTLTREQISRIAEPDPPESCGLRVAPLSMIEPGRPRTYGVDSVPGAGSSAPPPPPPPPPRTPPASSLQRTRDPSVEDVGSPHRIPAVADPREALFAFLIPRYQRSDGHQGKAICLSDTGPELLARLEVRYRGLHPSEACGWREGGVILKKTGEAALFMFAKVDCHRTKCAAEGGATYGNVGGEGIGYRMLHRGDGWSIQETGVGWIS